MPAICAANAVRQRKRGGFFGGSTCTVPGFAGEASSAHPEQSTGSVDIVQRTVSHTHSHTDCSPASAPAPALNGGKAGCPAPCGLLCGCSLPSPSAFCRLPPSSIRPLTVLTSVHSRLLTLLCSILHTLALCCPPPYSLASSPLLQSSNFWKASRLSSAMVKPLDLPGVSHSNERTPLLSTSVRSTVSSRSGGFLGPHNGEAFHSARTRRASLAALAARGGESEFGGERPGLARFREEWALSQAPQHPTLLESTFGGQSTSASGAASRDRSRDPPSGGSGDALDTDDEEDDRPAEAGEILDQVRVLAEEAGYVVPPERKDATRDLREAGILAAWATPQILIGF